MLWGALRRLFASLSDLGTRPDPIAPDRHKITQRILETMARLATTARLLVLLALLPATSAPRPRGR